jgi:DNA-3-methyladenine glycosylase II
MPKTSAEFVIEPWGPFSLEEAGNFGFGHRMDARFDGVLRLAFCLDGYGRQVGVEARQDPGGAVRCTAFGDPDPDLDRVARQVERILSLDHDGSAFLDVGKRDPVIRRLQGVARGLRPVLFHSPYEAAAWAVLSARRPQRQMAEVRRRLGEQYGRVFELAGRTEVAFPVPERLLTVKQVDGLNEQKVERLHAVAEAALSGQLDAGRLLAMDPGDAMLDVRSVPGIGPFYAALIVVRGTGFADVLPTNEPRALELTRRLYALDAPPSPDEFEAMAEPWRPFRTWATALIRAAGPRLLGAGWAPEPVR